MSNIDEPNVESTPNGSAWDWRHESEVEDNPPLFETITWNGYSANTGEYSAVLAKWSLDTENKLLRLERISVKFPYQPWDDTPADPKRYLTDTHRRMARKVAREYFDMEKFRNRTVLHPKDGWN